MEETIIQIINHHKNLFGENPTITKINVGFTNTIYSINDSFIIKICTNKENENNFKREIDFYNSNQENNLIPKLYYSNADKTEIPYYYEIIEKVKGVSLYNVWHTFTEEQREEIIKQLCTAMKQIHSNKGNPYDWTKLFKEQFALLYSKALSMNLFTEEEQQLINHAYSKFEKYLQSTDFVLVHNDLHFDNIFYDDGKIKIIDFERSMIAPKDFELDILFRMVRKPWKFASEKTEDFCDSSDYTSIRLYIERYYPELINIPHLSQRLAIYDMEYFLSQLIDYPHLNELKQDVLEATKTVALKDELTFDKARTPNELMDFMKMNIQYGWIDKNGEKHLNNLKGFRENYRTSSIEEILRTNLGTCIEQAKLIKLFFDKMGIENKLYCYRRYETEENFDKEVKMHCFVLFHHKDKWYHFEHSNSNKRGIHEFDSVESAIKSEIDRHDENDIRELVEIPSIPSNLSFKEFNQYVNTFDSITFTNPTRKL